MNRPSQLVSTLPVPTWATYISIDMQGIIVAWETKPVKFNEKYRRSPCSRWYSEIGKTDEIQHRGIYKIVRKVIELEKEE